MEVALELATAQGQWNLGENNNQWRVMTPAGEHLWSFPAKFDERDVMSAIRMGREFELKAFNIGIDFGKEEQREADQQQIGFLEGRVKSLIAMNEQLSEALDKEIGG